MMPNAGALSGSHILPLLPGVLHQHFGGVFSGGSLWACVPLTVQIYTKGSNPACFFPYKYIKMPERAALKSLNKLVSSDTSAFSDLGWESDADARGQFSPVHVWCRAHDKLFLFLRR